MKVVFLPWYNAYRFLVQSARRWEADHSSKEEKKIWRPDPAAAAASANVLDRWLLSSSRELARFVRAEMGAYRLYTVVPRLTRFVADLTNVYVRYNRSRLKGKEDGTGGGAAEGDDDDADDDADDAGEAAASSSSSDEQDRMAALSTLHSVLTKLCVIMAPFTPFLCELMWRNLRRALVAEEGEEKGEKEDSSLYPASVHWAPFPAAAEDREGDDAVRKGVEVMQRAIELARTVRERGVRPLKQPLRAMVVVHPDPAVLALLTREFLIFFLTSSIFSFIVFFLFEAFEIPSSSHSHTLSLEIVKMKPIPPNNKQQTADLRRYIVSQTNVRSLELTSDASRWCSAAAVPDWAVLGKRLGKGVSAVRAALANADSELLAKIEGGVESVQVAGFELGPGEVKVVRKFAPSAEALSASMQPGAAVDGAGDAGSALFVALDLSLDEGLLAEGAARDVASRVQKARKSAGLSAQDPAVAWLGGCVVGAEAAAGTAPSPPPPLPAPLAAALEKQAAWLKGAIGGQWRELRDLPAGTEELIREEHSLPAGKFELVLTRGE